MAKEYYNFQMVKNMLKLIKKITKLEKYLQIKMSRILKNQNFKKNQVSRIKALSKKLNSPIREEYLREDNRNSLLIFKRILIT
jgi:hypothetical protein